MEVKTKESKDECKEAKFITFTELVSFRQQKLEDMIKEFGAVYISCKSGAPLKVTLATLG